MISIRNLYKRHGERVILSGVSLEILRGQVLVIAGSSGAGKSTLLRCMNGLEPFDAGEIVVNETSLCPETFRGADARRVLRKIRLDAGMVFQSFCLFPHLSVLDNVMLAPQRVLGLSRAEAEQRALQLLERVHLSGREQQFPRSLSGGEQQRVAIARALAMKPEVLLFDEPTSSLDPELVGEVLGVIEDLAAERYTIVIVTHQMNFARRCATDIAFLDRGSIVEHGPAHDFFANPKSERAKAFLSGL